VELGKRLLTLPFGRLHLTLLLGRLRLKVLTFLLRRSRSASCRLRRIVATRLCVREDTSWNMTFLFPNPLLLGSFPLLGSLLLDLYN